MWERRRGAAGASPRWEVGRGAGQTPAGSKELGLKSGGKGRRDAWDESGNESEHPQAKMSAFLPKQKQSFIRSVFLFFFLVFYYFMGKAIEGVLVAAVT